MKIISKLLIAGSSTSPYYNESATGDELSANFTTILQEITRTTDPKTYGTSNGIVTITDGFTEGQKVSFYNGAYNANNTSNKIGETMTWSDFINSQYADYKNNKIEFKLGNFMRDKGLARNASVTIRFHQ